MTFTLQMGRRRMYQLTQTEFKQETKSNIILIVMLISKIIIEPDEIEICTLCVQYKTV